MLIATLPLLFSRSGTEVSIPHRDLCSLQQAIRLVLALQSREMFQSLIGIYAHCNREVSCGVGLVG